MIRLTPGSMAKIIFSILGLVLLLVYSHVFCQIDSIQTQIELKSSVDKSKVPFNRELTFSVEASWEGEQERFSITPLVPPQCENLEIMGSSSVNQTRMEQGKTMAVKIFRFALKPTQTGKGRIGVIQLSYVDNATQDSSSLSTQPIDVQITSPVSERGPKYKTILIFVMAAILIYVLYTARKRTRRIEIKPEQEVQTKTEKEETPEQRALRQLEDISEQMKKGASDSFSSDIYRLLTGYLEARYQIVTAGKTTNNIIDSLTNLDILPEKIGLLKEILTACDLAKFAAERMEKSRCEKMAGQIKEFLEQNR
jgi:cell division protein ZapA (FtsZ GTPase activity inhibitor)